MSTELSIGSKASLPSTYQGADDDFAGMRQRDIQMPNLRLMQQMSPLVVSEVAKSGDFAAVGSKQVIIPRGSKKFIVPMIFWLEWIKWNPKKGVPKEDMIISRSNDPQSDLAKAAERYDTYVDSQGKEKAVVTEYYNFICSVVEGDDTASDFSNLYVINFSKTGHRTGKAFLNKLARSKIRCEDGFVKAPIWYNQWELFATQETKEQNTFWVSQIGASKPTPVSVHEELKDTSDALKQRRQEIMDKLSAKSEADHEETSGGGTATPTMSGPAKNAKADESPF